MNVRKLMKLVSEMCVWRMACCSIRVEVVAETELVVGIGKAKLQHAEERRIALVQKSSNQRV